MLTLLLIVFPLLASLLVFFTKGNGARNIALGASVIEFVLSLVAFFQFRNNPAAALLEFKRPWVASLGVQYWVSMDALGLLMVMLTTFLVPLIILSSYKNEYEKPNSFYGLILMMQMALVGVFVANDGFLFYVFWELALIPIYFICLLWGGDNRAAITFKFFVYTLLGSLFMLVGLIYLYNHTNVDGAKSWAVRDLYEAGKALTATQQGVVFWLIFIAFAIKMPIIPFHT